MKGRNKRIVSLTRSNISDLCRKGMVRTGLMEEEGDLRYRNVTLVSNVQPRTKYIHYDNKQEEIIKFNIQGFSFLL